MRRVWPALLLLLGCPGSGGTEAGSAQPDSATESGESGGSGSGSDPSDPVTEDSSGGGSSGAGDPSTSGDATESGEPVPPPNLTPGCGTPATGAVLDGVIEIDGETRDYLIEVPTDYDPNTPYPIIFGFHGDSSDNAQAQSSYRLFEYYDGRAIVVYPNGSGAGGSPGWDTANGSRDFELVIGLAQEIGTEMCFDLSRVHAYGYSRGAAMSHAVGCYRGDLFTGIGASSGWAPSTGLCQQPIAVFLSHGLNDDRVSFATGRNARDAWAAYNGCSGETVALAQEGCVAFTDCGAEAPVQWCEFDGGHQFNTVYAEAAVRLFQSL